MSETMLMKQKCQECDNVPDGRQIFQCSHHHLMCIMCGLKNGRTCKLDKEEMEIANNPLILNPDVRETIINSNVCPYSKSGCQWVFKTPSEIQAHVKECKYRPYSCIGDSFNIWNCDWTGTQESFVSHAKEAHPHLSEFFNYWHNGSVPFSHRQTIRMVRLIDAFNKTFVFFYNSNGDSDELTFTVFLMGLNRDAERYLLDFELKQDQRKIKFLEKCHSDTDAALIRNGLFGCIIPKRLVETFATENGEINFRFIIKRADRVTAENIAEEAYLKSVLHSKNDEPKNDKVANDDRKSMGNEGLLDNVPKANNATKTANLEAARPPLPSTSQPPQKPNYSVEMRAYYKPQATNQYDESNLLKLRPTKIDETAFANIIQSLNLKKGSNSTIGMDNSSSSQSEKPFGPRFVPKNFLKKRFPHPHRAHSNSMQSTTSSNYNMKN